MDLQSPIRSDPVIADLANAEEVIWENPRACLFLQVKDRLPLSEAAILWKMQNLQLHI